MNNNETYRSVEEVLTGQSTSDGDGVKLKRVFGGGDLSRFDPFLMLDEFGSDQPSDYIGGFPPHPHRGFETVTYMLAGNMEHRDHMGNVGQLGAGGVQWMRAGSGVIHSEMPQQEDGLMRGFQLWVNLPAQEKMDSANYRDIPADDIPKYEVGNVSVKAIAGELLVNDRSLKGVVHGLSTDPAYLDLHFTAADDIVIETTAGYTSLIYIYEGSAKLGHEETLLQTGQLARLSRTGSVRLIAEAEARVLVMTGKPIGEPIVQKGPFVMNTTEEIQTAFREYSEGTLV